MDIARHQLFDSDSKPGALTMSLPEVIYRHVKDAIINGIYHPAQALRQEELALNLGVSRASLREVLLRLEAEGLVSANPRKGYAVRSLEPAEIREIFDLRILVEESTVYRSTKNGTPESVAILRALVAQMEEPIPKTVLEIATWSDLNFKFHNYLLSLSGRTHFCRIAANLRSAVEPYVRVEIGMTGDLDDAHSDHQKIVHAFACGDAVRVARLTREHYESTANRLIAGLSGRATERIEHPVEESSR